MKLQVSKLNINSKVINQLENWAYFDGSEELNRFILANGELNFHTIIERHLTNVNFHSYALLYSFCDKPLGLALVSTFVNPRDKNHVCCIDYICVDPTVKQKNIGSQMIEDITSNNNPIIKDYRITLFMANISPDNIASRKLFEKTGFKIDHEREVLLAYKYISKTFGE